MARILITDNGTHSSDKWAVTTAEMIFPLDDTAMVGERLIAAQKFQTKLAEVLSPHHETTMLHEKTQLKEDPNYFQTHHDASDHVTEAMKGILDAAHGSPWEQHFAKPDVQEVVRSIVLNHMQSAQHAERLWYAAHNRSEQGDHYMASYHG